MSGVLGSTTSGVDAFALPLAAAAAAARRRSLVGPGTGKTEGPPPALVGEASAPGFVGERGDGEGKADMASSGRRQERRIVCGASASRETRETETGRTKRSSFCSSNSTRMTEGYG